MVITTLLLVLVLVTFLQPTIERFQVAAWYTSSLWFTDIVFGDLPGETYFLVMALFNLITIEILHSMVIKTALTVRLTVISYVSIVVNAVGLTMWLNYNPPTLYVNGFVLIYGAAIISLLKRDDSDGSQLGNSANNRVWSSFFGLFDSRCALGFTCKGEV